MENKGDHPSPKDDGDDTVLSEPDILFISPVRSEQDSVGANPHSSALSSRYILGARIGRGGMGEVYEVWVPKTDPPLFVGIMRLSSRRCGEAHRRVEWRLRCPVLATGLPFLPARPSPKTDGHDSDCSTRSILSESGGDALR